MKKTSIVLLILIVALATFGVMKLLENIHERKLEAREQVVRVANVSETTIDPATWGQNFPRQYDSYKRTVDVARTRFGGSEAIQKLDADPRLRTLFAGYAFSIDYREERGHAYMLSDQRETERVTKAKQPGSCLHCHASNTVAYRQKGLDSGAPGSLSDPLTSANGRKQLLAGFGEVCAMPYDEATKLVMHPVACVDCHDPESMQLRITKPAFLEGVAALARSDDPLPQFPSIHRWREGSRRDDYDPNAEATRQEMRSFVCGQCHVEYYFAPPKKRVTYPWAKGLTMDAAEAYYDEVGWTDWKHKESGASTLKAQHPEFELWAQGIHSRSGVACADCHMPYVREGAVKVSDHHVQSPLMHVSRSCEVCHRYPEEELKARVETIQKRTQRLLDDGEKAVVALITEITQKKEAGATDERLKVARDLHRKAQWRLDYIAAENSMGFHAPAESARILAEAIDLARQGQIELLRHD